MKIHFFKRAKDIKREKTRLDFMRDLDYSSSHGYSIIKSSKSLQEQEFLMQISKNYDEYGYMTQELGEELDNLFLDDNYIIGIHRTGYTTVTNDVLEDIFNNGHAMYGAPTGQLDIDKTVSICREFPVLCGQLKSSHGYKGSEGCILVRIPKECLEETDKPPMPMYYNHNGTTRLIPQYIYGYVPVDKDGNLGNIHRNPNYQEMVIQNENLLFEDRVSIKARRNGYNIDIPKRPMNEKYNVLKNTCLDTLNKYGIKQVEYALIKLINENKVKYFSGFQNRQYLINHIAFGDIIKILSYGMDDLNNSDINSIVQNFIDSIRNSEIKRTL